MGLDMYLSAKLYIGANYEHNNIKGTVNLKKDGKKLNIPKDKITYIECTAAYWRKFNALHQYFVDNVQDGTDDCHSYYVSKEIIQEIIDLCKQVRDELENAEYELSEEHEDVITKTKFTYKIFRNVQKVEELLPTQEGFFFGSTDYDEYYLKDIVDTIEQLEKCLDDFDDGWEFYYQSSW